MSTDAVSLPHDLDAERALLGAALVNAEAFAQARDLVRAGDFFDNSERPAHGAIYRVLCSLLDAGSPLDILAIRAELDRTGKLDAAGGPAYLASLDGFCSRSADAPWYAARVANLAKRRRLVSLGAVVMEAAGNGTADADLARMLADWREDLRSLEPGVGGVESESLSEILARPAPATPWAVPGLIAEGDVGLISGPGGVGKSWLALSAAMSLATAWPLFSYYEIPRPYRVAFLDLESRPWETDQRLHRIAAGMGATAEALADRVQIIRRRLRLDSPEDLRRLTASLESWETDFLIVDSYRRAFSGDENSSGIVSAVFTGTLDRLRLETGCGTILLDHTRKLTGETDLDSPDQAVRGSTDKRNCVDFHLGIEARTGGLALTPTKTRHGRKPEPIVLEIEGLDGEDAEGPVLVKFSRHADPASDRVADSVMVLLGEAGDAGLLRGEIIGRSGFAERTVGAALRDLRSRGRIASQKDGKQARYRVAK